MDSRIYIVNGIAELVTLETACLANTALLILECQGSTDRLIVREQPPFRLLPGMKDEG
jgi:hypothetical protein